MSEFVWDCWVCDAPAPKPVSFVLVGVFDHEVKAHQRCVDAYVDRDRETIARLRAEACSNGHHRFSGRWEKDSADPYGDAALWRCAKGCGHIQRHPGYGIGRFLHDHGLAEPVQPALFD